MAQASQMAVNVLIVDDHRDNVVALTAVLENLPVNLVAAESGDEALKRLLIDEYAVVLLDVQMRGLNGFETAKRIRSHPGTRNIPIIFITGFDAEGASVKEAYSLGAVDYLVKPIEPVVLRAKVAGFVELFRKTEQIKLQAEQLRQMERKLADEALRESELRFARFMQHLPGLAWIKDVDGRYVYANEAAAGAFNVSREKLYGRADSEIFPPETAARFAENDRRALDTGAGIHVIESLQHPDGSQHQSIVSKFPIPGPGGRAAWVGGMAIDITDRVRAEEALKEADRRKDEFLATLAHELRNPLAPIRNSLEILELLRDDAEAVEQARAVMRRQVEYMVRLIDDLLDVSRISRGTLELRKERVELVAVVRSAVETSRPLIEGSSQQLVVTLPPDPIWITADVTRLAQVFANLLNNAAKFTAHGGHIRLLVERRANLVEVSIVDDGIGIPAEMLSKIFEMFTQVDPSLERAQSGLGIGLTIVKRLVEMHQGTIEALSAGPGHGSRFVVRLPVSADVGAPETAVERKPLRSDGGRRILVVDDNADALQSLAKMLRLLGHETYVARDGLEAVEVASIQKPEVVFMDLGMPRLNGFDACRQIRELPWAHAAVIVALTGWGNSEDRRRSAEAGFDQHLVKPVDLTKVEMILNGNGRSPQSRDADN
jgi:PAS domain S-box-containing protein